MNKVEINIVIKLNRSVHCIIYLTFLGGVPYKIYWGGVPYKIFLGGGGYLTIFFLGGGGVPYKNFLGGYLKKFFGEGTLQNFSWRGGYPTKFFLTGGTLQNFSWGGGDTLPNFSWGGYFKIFLGGGYRTKFFLGRGGRTLQNFSWGRGLYSKILFLIFRIFLKILRVWSLRKLWSAHLIVPESFEKILKLNKKIFRGGGARPRKF